MILSDHNYSFNINIEHKSQKDSKELLQNFNSLISENQVNGVERVQNENMRYPIYIYLFKLY